MNTKNSSWLDEPDTGVSTRGTMGKGSGRRVASACTACGGLGNGQARTRTRTWATDRDILTGCLHTGASARAPALLVGHPAVAGRGESRAVQASPVPPALVDVDHPPGRIGHPEMKEPNPHFALAATFDLLDPALGCISPRQSAPETL